MYTMNEGQLDPGGIGCATTTVGSQGALGKLELSAAFSEILISGEPFKLAEVYFTCKPYVETTLIDQLGIASGNASLFYSIILVVMMWLAGKVPGMVRESIVDGKEVNETTLEFSEVVKLVSEGRADKLEDKHIALFLTIADAIDLARRERYETSQRSTKPREVISTDGNNFYGSATI
mmetsp:Transcript_71756/g.144433  ORF Transcript_71756/g.144433 Transcript_71756/m.144433 type:complete len:178 (+) Transcript_71756:3-536(+)